MSDNQGGCSGMSYTMEFENISNDSVIEYDGFAIETRADPPLKTRTTWRLNSPSASTGLSLGPPQGAQQLHPSTLPWSTARRGCLAEELFRTTIFRIKMEALSKDSC